MVLGQLSMVSCHFLKPLLCAILSNISQQAQGYCLQVEDPWTSEFLKYQDMGFSREEVGMALGALGPDADQESQVQCVARRIPEFSSWALSRATYLFARSLLSLHLWALYAR